MKYLVLSLGLILAACSPLEPVMVDDTLTRHCNDPLLEEGQPCITDDRGTLLAVAVGSLVFLSSITGLGYYYKQRKGDS